MPPTLTTDRLTLRPWTGDDVDACLDLYSRWDVVRWLGRAPEALTAPEQALARFERWAAISDSVHGVWAVVPDGTDRPAGSVLLKLLPPSGGQAATDTEVGWHLHPDVWGRGYATESARALLDRAWRHGLSEVLAVTYPDNVRSQAVCERLGMAALGTTDRYYDTECALFRARPPG